MEKEFKLKITFNKAMTAPEQNTFWTKICDCLKSIHAFGGGQQDIFTLDWAIDYGNTHLDEYAVKKHIATFLDKQKEIVQEFSFYKP